MYDLIALIGTVQRHLVSRVWRATNDLICACGSVTRLSLIAGKHVGKDDPVLIIHAQHGLPAVGEALVPSMRSYLVKGWMRGSRWGPILTVGLRDSKCTVFDVPPRLVALGFYVANGESACYDSGRPIIADLFDDPASALARHEASQCASMLRHMGEFETARLWPAKMKYTTLEQALDGLKEWFKPAWRWLKCLDVKACL